MVYADITGPSTYSQVVKERGGRETMFALSCCSGEPLPSLGSIQRKPLTGIEVNYGLLAPRRAGKGGRTGAGAAVYTCPRWGASSPPPAKPAEREGPARAGGSNAGDVGAEGEGREGNTVASSTACSQLAPPGAVSGEGDLAMGCSGRARPSLLRPALGWGACTPVAMSLILPAATGGGDTFRVQAG